MARNHIHFAPGMPSSNGVISGMRSSCQIVIYVNTILAMSDGIKFYRSSNGVILSPGDESGFLSKRYFEKVADINGQLLYPENLTTTELTVKPGSSGQHDQPQSKCTVFE